MRGLEYRVDDCIPNLRTGNALLFLISLGVGTNYSFFRSVRPEERCRMQGLSFKRLARMKPARIVHATGSAFPVPLIGAALVSAINSAYGAHAEKRQRVR